MLPDYMYSTLNVSMPEKVYSGILNENVCGLIKISEADQQPKQEIIQHFLSLTSMMGYCVGFSNVITRCDLPAAYQAQAKFAVCNALETARDSLQFDDYALDCILQSAVGEQPIDILLNSRVRKLIDYDKAKNTDYRPHLP